jgi:hypothetical protein
MWLKESQRNRHHEANLDTRLVQLRATFLYKDPGIGTLILLLAKGLFCARIVRDSGLRDCRLIKLCLGGLKR